MGLVKEQKAVRGGTEIGTPSLDLNRNLWMMSSTSISAITLLRNEAVTTSANRTTVAFALAEPVLYLPHFDPATPAAARSVMLTGHLRLRLTKAIMINRFELVFKGVTQTKMSNAR